MTVKAIDWTEGDVGKIHVKLKRGSCRIDWGDGKSTSLFTYTQDWVSANHQYPSRCKVSGEMYEITISSLEDNITGFRVSSGDSFSISLIYITFSSGSICYSLRPSAMMKSGENSLIISKNAETFLDCSLVS